MQNCREDISCLYSPKGIFILEENISKAFLRGFLQYSYFITIEAVSQQLMRGNFAQYMQTACTEIICAKIRTISDITSDESMTNQSLVDGCRLKSGALQARRLLILLPLDSPSLQDISLTCIRDQDIKGFWLGDVHRPIFNSISFADKRLCNLGNLTWRTVLRR